MNMSPLVWLQLMHSSMQRVAILDSTLVHINFWIPRLLSLVISKRSCNRDRFMVEWKVNDGHSSEPLALVYSRFFLLILAPLKKTYCKDM